MAERHNLQKMLDRLEFVKNLPTEKSGMYLHMGCGPHVLDGFLNIDKYETAPGIFNADMYAVPLPEKSCKAIYSSHSLEHLPIRHALLAIQNWAKLLEPGGTLYLAVPDLEEIMRKMLDPNVSDDLKWNWYVYTLFGYQIDSKLKHDTMDAPVCLGQFHTCGFTKSHLFKLLQDAGLTVATMFDYDGWSTPSLWVEAIKP